MTHDWVYETLGTMLREVEHILGIVERDRERTEEAHRRIGALTLRVRRLERQAGLTPSLKDVAHLVMSVTLLIGISALCVLLLTGAIRPGSLVALLTRAFG